MAKRSVPEDFTDNKCLALDSNIKKSEQPKSLTAINDDCLRHIFQYLNLFEAIHLAATCKRLQNFAKTDTFARRPKKIQIEIAYGINKVQISVPVENIKATITLPSLETALTCLGEAVENIELNWHGYGVSNPAHPLFKRTFQCVLEQCPYLKLLQFRGCQFAPGETRKLSEQIEKFQNLIEFNLFGSPGITNNWPATLNGPSKVDRLSLTADTKINVHFFEHFRNLSSLTIDFSNGKWPANCPQVIFNTIGHCLEHLGIIGTPRTAVRKNYNVPTFQTLIEKLPKLKSISFTGTLSESTKFLIEMPQMKFLNITKRWDNQDSLLQTLSANDNIEELTFPGYWCKPHDHNDAMYATPLIFSRLQKLSCSSYPRMELLVRSQMPVIHSLVLKHIYEYDIKGLLTFLETKKTLKTVCLEFAWTFNVRSIVLRIVEILKVPCTPKRPFVKLKIYSRRFYNVVSK